MAVFGSGPSKGFCHPEFWERFAVGYRAGKFHDVLATQRGEDLVVKRRRAVDVIRADRHVRQNAWVVVCYVRLFQA